MNISIILPTYNRSQQLFRVLDSLMPLKFDKKKYEIIIVDNASTDITKIVVDEHIQKFPFHNIRYYYDDVPGLLTGRHRGALEAKAEILVFIDDDIHPDKGWLAAIFETFKRYPGTNIVGGKCLPIFETKPPDWLNYFWYTLPDGGKTMGDLSLCDFGDKEKEISPLLVWGLNYSIRKKTLFELGGFHPDCIPSQFQHFQGDGESGLSAKAITKGYKAIYQPKALVYHEVPTERMTLGYFDKRYFYQGICDSYTEIRSNKGFTNGDPIYIIKRNIKNIMRPIYRMFFPKPKVSIPDESNFEKEMLFARFRAMEKAGYNFHQEIARKNPFILNWILKKDYFNYNLPEL